MAAEEVARAQIIVSALDKTIMALRSKREDEWEEQIETLTRMREATIAKVHEVDPSVQFDVVPPAE